jgi:hypothetical protein
MQNDMRLLSPRQGRQKFGEQVLLSPPCGALKRGWLGLLTQSFALGYALPPPFGGYRPEYREPQPEFPDGLLKGREHGTPGAVWRTSRTGVEFPTCRW